MAAAKPAEPVFPKVGDWLLISTRGLAELHPRQVTRVTRTSSPHVLHVWAAKVRFVWRGSSGRCGSVYSGMYAEMIPEAKAKAFLADAAFWKMFEEASRTLGDLCDRRHGERNLPEIFAQLSRMAFAAAEEIERRNARDAEGQKEAAS